MIKNHPEVVLFPIITVGDKFYQIKNPSDFMSITDSDMASIFRSLL
ncbi:hypothetical protein [Aquimarina algiphila]|nr:hypothetical protein [Aquimarina algiphila]